MANMDGSADKDWVMRLGSLRGTERRELSSLKSGWFTLPYYPVETLRCGAAWISNSLENWNASQPISCGSSRTLEDANVRPEAVIGKECTRDPMQLFPIGNYGSASCDAVRIGTGDS